jgi:DNA polymerase-3 subunit gamma/tau
VGKTTCARIFAKAINCQNPTAEGEACNECESCQSFNEQRSLNIFELDAASNNSVEHIKTLMEQTRIPPQVGKYKVFIIDEVHMLSTQAFNAFLKTLEEPPAHVIFILATTEKHKILPTILSRCQIYDFERMTVKNTIDHLKSVAEKEGIKYEVEALAVIAEKADGGMRDALSIFDQAASFCQGNITYQKVTEDLNVLDTRYYFDIVNHALKNEVSEVMVLLNDIINKGFDGGLLIQGLARHVRNVLMAKDPQTLPLLEVGEEALERFRQQAQDCPTPFLYQSLRLMNQCDINYRQSSNKRLLVELTLIEMAQITQPDEGAGSGRRPRRLKSLFKQLVQSQTQPRTAAQQVAAAVQTAPQPEKVSTPVIPSVATPIAPAASMQRPALKAGSLGVTWKNLRNQSSARMNILPGTAGAEQGSKEENATFTQDELELQWMAMCNRMPQKQPQLIGLATRMKNMNPKVTDMPHVELVVSNEMVKNEIEAIQRGVLATLKTYLHNSGITLTLRVDEQQEQAKPLSRREQLEVLMKENPAIGMLCQEFDLELA